MNSKRTTTRTAIGLYHDGEAAHALRATLDDDAWDFAAHDGGEPADHQPLGIAIDAIHGLHRRMALPASDRATARRAAALQIDTMLPGQDDNVAWGWQRGDADAPVLLFTTGKKTLEHAHATNTFQATPSSVTPAVFALSALLNVSSNTSNLASLSVLVINQDHAHLLILRDQQTIWAGSLGLDSNNDASDANLDALAAWHTQVIAELDNTSPSEELVVLVDDEQQRSWEEGLSRRIGATALPATAVFDMPGLPSHKPATLFAAGAAMAAARPRNCVNLLDRPEDDFDEVAVTGPSRRAWFYAAVWLIVATAAVYLLDTRAAEHYETTLDDHGIDAASTASLRTQLDTGRYLETTGPTLLAILDEISHSTSNFLLDELRYERDGNITFRGTANSSDEVNNIASQLANMRTLTEVQVRSQNVKDRKITYTLIAKPSPRFTAAFTPPPRDTKETKTKEKTSASEQPATQPQGSEHGRPN